MTPGRICDDLKPLSFPIDQLTELEGNPRRGNVDAVAASYARFGQEKPIVARHRDGIAEVLAGNHQLQAARKLGWDTIAVVWADHFSDEEARAFSLADNRSADLGTYDDDLLVSMLSAIVSDTDLLAATGYDLEAIEKLVGTPDFGQGAEQPSLDELGGKVGKQITCPSCGHQFEMLPSGAVRA